MRAAALWDIECLENHVRALPVHHAVIHPLATKHLNTQAVL